MDLHILEVTFSFSGKEGTSHLHSTVRTLAASSAIEYGKLILFIAFLLFCMIAVLIGMAVWAEALTAC